MLPQEIIKTKRDNHVLSEEQIDIFVRGVVDESVTEGQIAAMAMAPTEGMARQLVGNDFAGNIYDISITTGATTNPRSAGSANLLGIAAFRNFL